jgi:hypothetical protein
VAGGELLIPTLVLLCGADAKQAGSFMGGQLLGIAPSEFLLPFLAAILLVSATKVWQHR